MSNSQRSTVSDGSAALVDYPSPKKKYEIFEMFEGYIEKYFVPIKKSIDVQANHFFQYINSALKDIPLEHQASIKKFVTPLQQKVIDTQNNLNNKISEALAKMEEHASLRIQILNDYDRQQQQNKIFIHKTLLHVLQYAAQKYYEKYTTPTLTQEQKNIIHKIFKEIAFIAGATARFELRDISLYYEKATRTEADAIIQLINTMLKRCPFDRTFYILQEELEKLANGQMGKGERVLDPRTQHPIAILRLNKRTGWFGSWVTSVELSNEANDYLTIELDENEKAKQRVSLITDLIKWVHADAKNLAEKINHPENSALKREGELGPTFNPDCFVKFIQTSIKKIEDQVNSFKEEFSKATPIIRKNEPCKTSTEDAKAASAFLDETEEIFNKRIERCNSFLNYYRTVVTQQIKQSKSIKDFFKLDQDANITEEFIDTVCTSELNNKEDEFKQKLKSRNTDRDQVFVDALIKYNILRKCKNILNNQGECPLRCNRVKRYHDLLLKEHVKVVKPRDPVWVKCMLFLSVLTVVGAFYWAFFRKSKGKKFFQEEFKTKTAFPKA